MRGTGELTYRERARIKTLVLRETEHDTQEIYRLRAKVRELEKQLASVRASRDRWRRAAYRCGGYHATRVVQ